MSTTHHMKMAKASQADIDAAIQLHQFLRAMSQGRSAPEVVDEFGYTGYGDLLERQAAAVEFALRAYENGDLFRVVWGMQTLLDPRNEVVDPNLPHLELHPKHTQAARELDALCKAKNEAIDERDALLAAVMDGTAEFRDWQECEADAIEGQEAEVERDHNRMLAALRTLRRKAEHVQNGTRAVVDEGSLPAHLERAEPQWLAIIVECDGSDQIDRILRVLGPFATSQEAGNAAVAAMPSFIVQGPDHSVEWELQSLQSPKPAGGA